MKKERDYVSPIFEHKLGDSGRGIAGFTVHQHGEPFVNCIRLYTEETRTGMMNELLEERNNMLNNHKTTTAINEEEISL